MFYFDYRNEIVSRIRDYNLYKENKVDHIKHREVSENLLYEGVIRLYWGLNKPIILSSGGPNYGRQRGFRESLYNYVSIDDEGFSKLFESSQVCVYMMYTYTVMCMYIFVFN